VFGYCIVVSLTAFSVICNKTFYKVYTLLSHTPHHTKSPLGSRGRDRMLDERKHFSQSGKPMVSVAVSKLGKTDLVWYRMAKFKFKMADGRHTGKCGKYYNSPISAPTGTKLGLSHPIMSPTCPP